jgi:hypothetical protein
MEEGDWKHIHKERGACCIILLYYIPYMWEWFEDKARKLA